MLPCVHQRFVPLEEIMLTLVCIKKIFPVTMKKILQIPLFLLLLTGFSYGQSIKNMTLVGHLSYTDQLNDVWAYVDSAGNEYAIVGANNSTSIVSLATPSSPVELFNIPGASSIWRDMKIYGNYAYVTNETANGLLIIDMSGLPGSIAWKDTVIAGLNTAHNIWIADGKAYVVGADIDFGGITIFDLTTDPWNPSKIGAFDARYVHDVYVRDDTAYAGEINDGLLEIIDVSNPATPVVLGTKSYINSFTHNTWLSDDGDVCFTTDELAEAYIYAWDVSDPGNIKELDKIRSSLSNGMATPHNTHVLDDYLVTSYYKDGINIVDADRPHNMIEVGYYDTNTLTGGGTDGCWGAYPFLPSGLVLGTDMNEGLFVFDVDYVRGCYLEGTVTDTVTGLAIPGAEINIATGTAVDFADAAGEYATGVADSGTYSVTYSAFGYYSKTFNFALDNGVLLVEDVQLVPITPISYNIQVRESGTGAPIANALVEAVSGTSALSYTADAGGDVSDPSFIPGSYAIYAGKWGWRTDTIIVSATSSSTSAIIYLDKGYYDDFYFDFNWTVSGSASRGEWERGEPNGTSYFGLDMNPEDDVTGDFGDEAYVTGNDGGTAGNDDVDNGTTILASPSMDLSIYDDPVIRFYRWFANDGGSGSPNDDLIIKLYNGSTSATVSTLSFTENFWKADSFRVSDFLTPTANMRVEFECSDYSPGHLVEGAIDMFEVNGQLITNIKDATQHTTQLTVYPNPAVPSSQVYYYYPTELANVRFEVKDLLGRVIMTKTLDRNEGQFTLGMQGISSGIYVGSLISEDETIETFRITK